MHGLIVGELQRFVAARAGDGAWEGLTADAPAPLQAADPKAVHPDADVVAVIVKAAGALGADVQDVLRDFGEFLVPALLDHYRPLVTGEWSALDLIEQTEAVIHTAVRLQQPGARPPALSVTRTATDELVVDYRSERRMCAVAEGIATGIAGQYGATFAITQTTCMLRGDEACAIHVKQV